MPIDDVTFTLSDVVQIVVAILTVASAWFWLRGQFHRNSDRLQRVEGDVTKYAEDSTVAITEIGVKIDNLTETVVRIDTRGQVLEEKFAMLTTK